MMKKDENTYITKTLIINEELDDLDLKLGDEFNHDYESDDGYLYKIEGKTKCDTDWRVNTTSINVEYLLKLIKKFKRKGVTHIQMEHYGDHHGYIFSGFKILPSTQEEILKDNNRTKATSEKQNKINKLIKEIRKIEKSINN